MDTDTPSRIYIDTDSDSDTGLKIYTDEPLRDSPLRGALHKYFDEILGYFCQIKSFLFDSNIH